MVSSFLKATIFYLIVMALVGIFISYIDKKEQKEKERLEAKALFTPTPYSLEIKNDHTVYLTNSTDTIMMHFENAYALSEESIVFIKRK